MYPSRRAKTVLVVLGLAPALAAAATSYDRARVVSVEPLYETVSYEVPREECRIEEVRHARQASQRSYTVPIVGAIVGGAIGNAVGHKKRNKQIGTVVGAVLGGSIGADIARHRHVHGHRREYSMERVCRTVSDWHEEQRLLGYRVTYRYAGETYVTRMEEDPGPSLPVRVRVTPV
ncbi:MAG: glycine zipper 2TM domain-containing protein [Pseudomonadales bacterium]|nr:glycine zipper 2TM domain-containing protein [Pseudomonadales bacterium]NIX08462.1 glycine zipper 2TM domain-containing protein [Pseudomonadales bacterium]